MTRTTTRAISHTIHTRHGSFDFTGEPIVHTHGLDGKTRIIMRDAESRMDFQLYTLGEPQARPILSWQYLNDEADLLNLRVVFRDQPHAYTDFVLHTVIVDGRDVAPMVAVLCELDDMPAFAGLRGIRHASA